MKTYGQGSTGDFYNGSWKNDTKWGYGVQKWKDGAKYQGDFVRGHRQGYGIMIFSKTDKLKRESYEGSWEEDRKSGIANIIVICMERGSKYRT